MKHENKAFTDLMARVTKLEKAVFGGDQKRSKVTEQKDFKGATGGLRLLISRGFFDRKHTFGEIEEALSGRGYHYSKQAIQTPLNTLSKAGGPLVGFKKEGKKVYAKRK